MIITLYSVFTSMVWSSLFLMMFYVCLNNTRLLRYVGARALYFMIVMCLLRLVLPVEFSFTKVVAMPEVLNPIRDFFYTDIPTYQGTVIAACVFVWAVVGLILMISVIARYYSYFRQVGKLQTSTTKQIRRITNQIIPAKDKSRVTVTLSTDTSVPLVGGFKKCVILLPLQDYTDKELALILEHEYNHIKHNDAYIRLFMQLICSIYWWQPMIWIIKFNLDKVLELLCDSRVIGDNNDRNTILYGETILKFARTKSNHKISFVTFEFSYDKEMKQRFHLLFPFTAPCRNKMIISAFTTTMAVFLLVTSYLLVFQSDFYIPLTNEITVENPLVIEKNMDGNYTVYFEDNILVINQKEYDMIASDGFIINNFTGENLS